VLALNEELSSSADLNNSNPDKQHTSVGKENSASYQKKVLFYLLMVLHCGRRNEDSRRYMANGL
jgi:hypothetical protein